MWSKNVKFYWLDSWILFCKWTRINIVNSNFFLVKLITDASKKFSKSFLAIAAGHKFGSNFLAIKIINNLCYIKSKVHGEINL